MRFTTDTGEKPLERTRKEIESPGGEALVVRTDVSKAGDVKGAVDATLERFVERYLDAFRHMQPLEQRGEIEDIARCAVFLASEGARFILDVSDLLGSGQK